MPDAAIAEQMRRLAETLASTTTGLDFSLASLRALERLAKKSPRSDVQTRACGAYLGEVLRRQAPDLGWVSFETASKSSAMIAKLTPGPDLDAILQAGQTFWFPLSKVEKFQKNGAEDSLTPFAHLVLAALPQRRFTPEQEEVERARLLAAAAHVDAAMQAFRMAPTAASVLALDRSLFGNVARRDMPGAFARLGLDARAIIPFLGVRAEGRGLKRQDCGAAAAAIVMQLIAQGAAPRDTTLDVVRGLLADPSKDARRNAARVLAYCDLTVGRTDVLLALTGSRDRNTVRGALCGLRSVTGDWRMGYATPTIAMAPLAPMLQAMLRPKSPHLAVALDIVSTWAWHRQQRHELAWVADALLALLDHPKRETQKQAGSTVQTYLLAILHGSAPRDDAFETTLSKRKDGFGKPTLEKIRGGGPARPAAGSERR